MQLLTRVVRGLKAVSMAGLLVMMGVTIVDVTMRVTLGKLVLGSVELVELALVVVVFLALPEATLARAHVTVDVIDQYVSVRTRRRLRRGAALVCGILLTVTAWRTVPPALDVIEIGDLTTDLKLSLIWYWLPIVVGFVAAAAAAWAVWRDEPTRDGEEP